MISLCVNQKTGKDLLGSVGSECDVDGLKEELDTVLVSAVCHSQYLSLDHPCTLPCKQPISIYPFLPGPTLASFAPSFDISKLVTMEIPPLVINSIEQVPPSFISSVLQFFMLLSYQRHHKCGTHKSKAVKIELHSRETFKISGIWPPK